MSKRIGMPSSLLCMTFVSTVGRQTEGSSTFEGPTCKLLVFIYVQKFVHGPWAKRGNIACVVAIDLPAWIHALIICSLYLRRVLSIFGDEEARALSLNVLAWRQCQAVVLGAKIGLEERWNVHSEQHSPGSKDLPGRSSPGSKNLPVRSPEGRPA